MKGDIFIELVKGQHLFSLNALIHCSRIQVSQSILLCRPKLITGEMDLANPMSLLHDHPYATLDKFGNFLTVICMAGSLSI